MDRHVGPERPSIHSLRPAADVRADVERLRLSGLSMQEASLLAARGLGLPAILGKPWTWRELQHLDFVRWLADTGRIQS